MKAVDDAEVKAYVRTKKQEFDQLQASLMKRKETVLIRQIGKLNRLWALGFNANGVVRISRVNFMRKFALFLFSRTSGVWSCESYYSQPFFDRE